MASKRTPALETEEEKTNTTAPETTQEALMEAAVREKEQQAEIERLKAELAKARASSQPAPVARKTDKENVQEAIQQAIAEHRNLWDVKIAVRSRPRVGTTEKHYWMGVNGRFMALPADDKYYELPLPFAECLVNAMDAERFVKDYADKNIQVYDLISNPHAEEKEM